MRPWVHSNAKGALRLRIRLIVKSDNPCYYSSLTPQVKLAPSQCRPSLYAGMLHIGRSESARVHNQAHSSNTGLHGVVAVSK